MQVSSQILEGVQRKITVSLPAESINEKIQTQLNEFKNTVRLPGFRLGKVPFALVKKRFFDSAKAEVLEKFIQETLPKALEQEKLEPISRPEINVESNEEDSNFVYSAVFEINPEIIISQLEKIKVNKPKINISEQDIEKMMANMRQQHATYVPVDRSAQLKDQVTADISGRVNGELFKEGQAKDFKVVIGSGQTIPGFEDGFIGHKASEEFDIKVTFPDTYHAKDLASKTAVFHTLLKEVAEQKLPELNEDFFKLFDIQEGGLEAFRKQVIESMESIVVQSTRQKLKSQVFEQLIKFHDFPIPESLVHDEIHRLESHAKKGVAQHNEHEHEHEHEHDHHHGHDHHHHEAEPSLRQQAIERVKLGLLAQKFVSEFNIQVNQNEVDEKIDIIVKKYAYPEQMKRHFSENQNLFEQIQAEVVEDKIIDHILERASVEEVLSTYDELLNLENKTI